MIFQWRSSADPLKDIEIIDPFMDNGLESKLFRKIEGKDVTELKKEASFQMAEDQNSMLY